MIRTIATLCFLAVSPAALAQSSAIADACTSVYQQSTVNLSTMQKREAEAEQLYSQMCSGSEVKAGLSVSDVLLSAVGVSGSFEKQKQFCSKHNESKSSASMVDTYSRQVVVDALQNFNSCIELAANETTVSAAVGREAGIQVQVTSRGDVPNVIGSFSSSPNLTCSGTDISGVLTTLTAGSYRFPAGGFSFDCRRAAESDGNYATSCVNFSLNRATAPFAFDLPSSDGLEHQAELAEMQSQLLSYQSALRGVDAYQHYFFWSDQSDLMPGGFWKGSKVESKPFTFEHATCQEVRDPNPEYRRRLCRPGYRAVSDDVVFSWPDVPTCGRTLYAITCLKVPEPTP